MLVAAALVPPTALLVPGAAGRARVLDDERAASLAAVADLLAARPDRVLLVVGVDPDRAGPPSPGVTTDAVPRPGAVPAGAARAGSAPADAAPSRFRGPTPSLAAAGVPGRGPGVEPALAVGRWLLDRAGTRLPTLPVLAAGGRPAAELRALGAAAAGPDRVAAVAVGGLSARRGEDAPLPVDPRAAAVDEAVLAWWRGGPEVPGDLARELAVSAWAPLQVLAGAPAAPTVADVRLVTCPFGATYAVATRLPEGP